MQDITTQGILSLFETTKEQRSTFVADIIERLDNGEIDPIKAHLQIKAMESIVKDLNANEHYKAAVLAAAEKNGRKFSAFNAEFAIKEMGVKYDYTYCGNTDLLLKQQQLEKLAAEIKELQDFLKKVKPEGVTVVDEETGAVNKFYPPSKSSTTSVVVTLK